MLKYTIASLAIATSSLPATAAVLDFNELSSGAARTTVLNGIFPSTQSFNTGGFTFSSQETVFAYGPENSNAAIPRSGSAFLNTSRAGSNTAPVSLSFEQTDGTLFSVQSLRVAEGRTSGRFSAFGSASLLFRGTLSTGETVSYSHVFDGIASGNAATDFETVTLAGFESLSSLTLIGVGGERDGYSFGVDDITVNEAPTLSAVPLPASVALLFGAFGGLGLMRRAQSRRTHIA